VPAIAERRQRSIEHWDTRCIEQPSAAIWVTEFQCQPSIEASSIIDGDIIARAIQPFPDPSILVDRVICVDPSVQRDGEGDTCGIIVAGIDASETIWIIADHTTHYPLSSWVDHVTVLAAETGASQILIENNQGGAVWEHLFADLNIPSHGIHAKGNKAARAHAAARLITGGQMKLTPDLNLVGELLSFDPAKTSPGAIDATALAIEHYAGVRVLTGAIDDDFDDGLDHLR
jgi:phage terminase large subunit-like protein